MVPDGWKLASLGDLCSKPISYGIVQTGDYVKGGIPCVRVVDLTKKEISVDEMITTTDEINQAYKKTILEQGELIIALRGVTGLVRIVCADIAGANLTRGIARISPKSNLVKSNYLLWAIRAKSFRNDLMRRVGGSALQEIALGELRQVKTLIPPLPEQTKIAQILSTWDKAIATVEKLIENSKQQKKALMQQLLTGKKRLPGFSGEWKECPIGKMGKVVSGGTPDTNTPEFWNGDINWMTPTDVTALKSRHISKTKRKITEKGMNASSATMMPLGSLLVCTRATVGLMSISATDITTNQGFKNIIPNSNFNVDFLYYLFTLNKQEFIRHACGSTFLELSKKDFVNLKFSCPKIDEQVELIKVLSSADTTLETQIKHLEHLKTEKKALMQQLLTGKRRVKVNANEAMSA